MDTKLKLDDVGHVMRFSFFELIFYLNFWGKISKIESLILRKQGCVFVGEVVQGI